MSKRIADALPLQVFIRRAQVLKLYRTMFRLTKPVAGGSQEQMQHLRAHIRDRFKTYKCVDDSKLVATLLSDGQRQLEQLKAVVRPHNHSSSSSSSVVGHTNSWINTKDENDPRGRVGEGWPWER